MECQPFGLQVHPFLYKFRYVWWTLLVPTFDPKDCRPAPDEVKRYDYCVKKPKEGEEGNYQSLSLSYISLERTKLPFYLLFNFFWTHYKASLCIGVTLQVDANSIFFYLGLHKTLVEILGSSYERESSRDRRDYSPPSDPFCVLISQRLREGLNLSFLLAQRPLSVRDRKRV